MVKVTTASKSIGVCEEPAIKKQKIDVSETELLQTSPVDMLVKDIMHQIFKMLDARSLEQVKFVCKSWNRYFNSMDWRVKCQEIHLPIRHKENPRQDYFRAMRRLNSTMNAIQQKHINESKILLPTGFWGTDNRIIGKSWMCKEGLMLLNRDKVNLFDKCGELVFALKHEMDIMQPDDQLLGHRNYLISFRNEKNETNACRITDNKRIEKIWDIHAKILKIYTTFGVLGNEQSECVVYSKEKGDLSILNASDGKEIDSFFLGKGVDFKSVLLNSTHIICSDKNNSEIWLINRANKEKEKLDSDSNYLLTESYLVESSKESDQSVLLNIRNLKNNQTFVKKLSFEKESGKISTVICRVSDQLLEEVCLIVEFFNNVGGTRSELHILNLDSQISNLLFYFGNEKFSQISQVDKTILMWTKIKRQTSLYAFNTIDSTHKLLYKAITSDSRVEYSRGNILEIAIRKDNFVLENSISIQ